MNVQRIPIYVMLTQYVRINMDHFTASAEVDIQAMGRLAKVK